jgi:hypothetical protein
LIKPDQWLLREVEGMDVRMGGRNDRGSFGVIDIFIILITVYAYIKISILYALYVNKAIK